MGWIETYDANLLRQAPSTRRRDHLTTTHRGAVLEVDFHKRRIRIARSRDKVKSKTGGDSVMSKFDCAVRNDGTPGNLSSRSRSRGRGISPRRFDWTPLPEVNSSSIFTARATGMLPNRERRCPLLSGQAPAAATKDQTGPAPNRRRKRELTRLEQSTQNLPNSGMRTQRAIILCYQLDGGFARKANAK